jgi:hypothetical protein
MTALLKGIYKHGKIELVEPPHGLREGRVRVLLTDEPELQSPSSQILFGRFPGDVLPTEDDFKIAEWHGDESFDEQNGV